MPRLSLRACSEIAAGTKKLKLPLTERHEALLEGRIPPLTYEEAKGKYAMAERFGAHGLQSGVDIRRLWPTVQELQRAKELKLHRTADEARRLAERNAAAKAEREAKKAQEVDENYTKWVASLKDGKYEMPVQAAPVEETEAEDAKPKRGRRAKK